MNLRCRYTVAIAAFFLLTAVYSCKGVGDGKKDSDRPAALPDEQNALPAAIFKGGSTYQNKAEGWQKFRLPDSTDVLLHDKSLLHLPVDFNKNDRQLQLDGEAVFIVSEDSDKPFIIHTHDLHILVMGTRFKVDAHAANAGEEVDLLSGRLKVMKSYHSSTDNEPETLQSGDMVMINRDIDLMEKEKMDSTELKNLQKLF